MDATFLHPFTCIINGPSGCGKTTFVKELLLDRKALIGGEEEIRYILIYIGTTLDENPIFKFVKDTLPDLVTIIQVRDLYDGSQKAFEEKFAEDFQNVIRNLGRNGCVIFDDLMVKLGRANLLADLFSKYSSHMKLSVIHITQNVFHRGKQQQEHRTVYTSCHHLVLFKQPMDATTFQIVAKRVHGSVKYSTIYGLLTYVANKYRYVIVSGNIGRNDQLKYTSDIFCSDPVRFQRAFIPNLH